MERNTVTLDDMLAGKESRAAYQIYLIDKYKCPLISFTVVMPGSVKQNKLSEKIFHIGKAAIESALGRYHIKFKDERNKKTGYEAFYCVDLPLFTLKKLMTDIEDEHKIGRLFDIDVIGADKKPVSRSTLGMNDRKCLVCDGVAHICSREKKHTTDELIEAIERLLSNE